MLELDLLLGRFLENQYDKLSSAEKLQFLNLLKLEDSELYAYLFGQVLPDNAEIRPLIQKINPKMKM